MNRPRGDIFLKLDGSGQKAAFHEVFPEVETLEATVTETGPGNHGLGVRRFNRNSYREFINCSNVQCSGHGAPTGQILRELTRSRKMDYAGTILCEGREESGKACSNVFELTLRLTYKSA